MPAGDLQVSNIFMYSRCSGCNEEISIGQSAVLYESKIFCSLCTKDIFCRCAVCGCIMDREPTTYPIECSACRTVLVVPDDFCIICHEPPMASNRYVTENGAIVCVSCYVAHYDRCHECGVTLLPVSGTRTICHHCEDMRARRRAPRTSCSCGSCLFSRLAFCGEATSTIQQPIIEYAYPASPTSRPEEEEDYEETDYDQEDSSVIADPEYKPTPKFKGAKGPYYGIELEVDFYDSDEDTSTPKEDCAVDLVEISKKVGNAFYLKDDGSLGDGFEIVSHPHNLEAWDKQDWLKTACNKVIDAGGRSFKTTTCGLHIHRSRKDLDDLTLTKTIAILIKLQPIFEKIAQRRSNGFCEYDFQGYAKASGEEGLLNGKVLYKNIKDKKILTKYIAMSMRYRETIEFRIFKGTLAAETVLALIHFVDRLMAIMKARKISYAKIIRLDGEELWKALRIELIKDSFVKAYFERKGI